MRKTLETRIERLEGSGRIPPIHEFNFMTLNCGELRELIRLMDWVIDHGGDQDLLPPADRAILRELHKITTGEIERAGRSPPALHLDRCAP